MKHSVLLFAILTIIFAGCSKNPQDVHEPDDQVIINFSADAYAKSLLKATIQATEAENAINNVILFGVDAENNYVAKYTIDHAPGASELVTISRKVVSLYAIANPSAEHAGASPANVATLMDMTGKFDAAPVSPFLMGGVGTITGTGASRSANIQLIRAVAKVEIKGIAGFNITSVTVDNTPKLGFVFKQASVTVPSGAGRAKYDPASGTAPILYVAESPATNPAKFTVAGEYGGKTISYDVYLKLNGSNIAIERNKYYQVSVKPVTEDDCTIAIKIEDWVIAENDPIETIPDSAFE